MNTILRRSIGIRPLRFSFTVVNTFLRLFANPNDKLDPLFPNANLSLHLFEPRYKLMMQRIVCSTRCFAYVPKLDSYTPNIGDVALKAVLKEVEFLPDGRCLLEAKLEGRYRILEFFVEEGTQGLHYCRMELFRDEDMNETDASEVLALRDAGHALCRQLMQGNIRQRIESCHGLPPMEVEAFSLWLCGVCLNDHVKKMELLQSRTTLDRMRVGMECLRNLVNRLELYMQTLTSTNRGIAAATSFESEMSHDEEIPEDESEDLEEDINEDEDEGEEFMDEGVDEMDTADEE